jgi:hypothetical protein
MHSDLLGHDTVSEEYTVPTFRAQVRAVRTLLGWLQGTWAFRFKTGTVNRKMALFEAIIALIKGTGGSREKMETSSNSLLQSGKPQLEQLPKSINIHQHGTIPCKDVRIWFYILQTGRSWVRYPMR